MMIRLLLALCLLLIPAAAREPFEAAREPFETAREPFETAPEPAALEPFEAALDAFEYERALALIEKLPPGPRRDLALAQHAVLSGRAERSFGYTDRLAVPQLPAELLAEYYLVRAYQEQASIYGLDQERQTASERMFEEGLRAPQAEPRDRARLLLYRVETCPATAPEPARQAAQALAEMAGIDPRFALTAAASLEQSSEAYGKADILWKALADAALATGEQRAADLYALNRCIPLARLKRKPEAYAVASLALERALKRQDPVAAGEAVFAAYATSPEKDAAAKVFLPAIPRMPDSFEKLLVMQQALAELEPSEIAGLPQKALAIAQQVKEPLLEAMFLSAMARREADPEVAQERWDRAQALLAAWDGRGAKANFWYRGLLGNKGEKLETSFPKVASRPIDGTWAEKLAGMTEPAERASYCGQCASKALSDGRPDIAEQAMLQAFQETAKLPAPERYRQTGSLLSILGPYERSSEAPDDLLRLRWAGGRALLHKIASQPAVVSQILETHLVMIGREVNSNDLRGQRESLARWLAGLGRLEEAEEIYGMLLAGSEIRNYLLSDQARTAHWIGQDGALDGLWKTDQAMKSWWKTSVENGWWALSQQRPDLAERWARSAFQTLGEGKRSEFLEARPYALLATALSRQGKHQDGLQVLAEALADDPKGSWLSYSASQVELLMISGKLEEASTNLAILPAPSTPSETFRQLELRRNLALAQGQPQMAADLLEQMTALYRASVTGLNDPVFAHFYGSAMASRLKLPVPPLPAVPLSTLSFAQLVEGLERLRQREPANESLRLLSAADLKKVMEGAASSELYVHPVLLQSSIALICLSHDKVDLVEVFCDRAKLDRELGQLTQGLVTPGSSLQSLEPSRRYLSRWLVQPWRQRFPGKTQLRWLGQDQLRRLSLASLYDSGGKELIQAIELSYVDGPGYRQIRLGKDAGTLLIGGAEDLPGADAELAMVRKAFPRGQDWTIGEPMAGLDQAAQGARLVHIATHGLSPSGTRLAGALGGDRGQVSAFDLSALSLSADCLAVIGACESAVDGQRGRDNSSLVSALRTAGAAVVMGSQWELQDEVTSRLFTRFYEGLRSGATPESALAAAQRSVRATHPHPYYWAGLQVISGP